MEPGNLRENWELIGDVFYEKFEVYEMEWADKVGIETCDSAPMNLS